MEATIGSLEAQLASAEEEKELSNSNAESLASEMQSLSDELSMSRLELDDLQKTNLDLRSKLEDSKSCNHKTEESIKLMVEEKEELAMQLMEALLAMEEEKAIWSKEKASSEFEAIEAKSRAYTSEIALLSREITEVRNQLSSCREDCEVLKERLSCSEENSRQEKEHSKEKYLEAEKLINDLKISEAQMKRSQEELIAKLQQVSSDHRYACEHVEKLKMELNVLNKEKENLLNETRESNQVLQNKLLMVTTERDAIKCQIKEQKIHQMATESSNLSGKLLKANAEIEDLTGPFSKLEAKMHDDEVVQNKEKTKLRMRLRGTNAKKDALGVRYEEAIQENNLMHTKFKEASNKLKAELASYVEEIFKLRKQQTQNS